MLLGHVYACDRVESLQAHETLPNGQTPSMQYNRIGKRFMISTVAP